MAPPEVMRSSPRTSLLPSAIQKRRTGGAAGRPQRATARASILTPKYPLWAYWVSLLRSHSKVMWNPVMPPSNLRSLVPGKAPTSALGHRQSLGVPGRWRASLLKLATPRAFGSARRATLQESAQAGAGGQITTSALGGRAFLRSASSGPHDHHNCQGRGRPPWGHLPVASASRA